MKNHIVRLLWLIRSSVFLSVIMSVCHIHKVLVWLSTFSQLAVQLNSLNQVVHKLCFQLFAQGTSTILSCALLPHAVCLEIFWECCPAEIQSLQRPFQPLPVLSLHFSYEARQPSTSLSNVTSAWRCMVLPSLTSMALWLTHCSSLTQKHLIWMCIIYKKQKKWNSNVS